MKKLVSLPFLFLLLACASHKEKHQTLQHSLNRQSTLRTEVKDHLYTQGQMDSSHNFWQFYSHEPFTYHPDSGLRGQAGLLDVKRYTAHRSLIIEDKHNERHEGRDSLRRNQKEIKENTTRKPIAKTVLYLGLGLICLIGMFFIYKKFNYR